MKVDVITVADIQIKPWRWWSNWVDVCVFDYINCGYLLQMRVSRTNLKSFKVIPFKSIFKFAHPNIHCVGELNQMPKQGASPK